MKNRTTAAAGALTVKGVEYVIIPKAEYLRLRGAPAGRAALSVVDDAIASDLRKAREHAGFTQAQLAERLGKSQTMISQAESGTTKVSERYIRTVLKACGLPEDWNGKGAPKKKRARARDHEPRLARSTPTSRRGWCAK